MKQRKPEVEFLFGSKIMPSFALIFLVLFLGPIAAFSDNPMTIVERILPAYAIARNAKVTLNSDDNCARQLGAFQNGIDARKLWALKMLDSSGEPKPGFIYGNNYWLGSRSQCIDTMNRKPFVLLEEFMKNITKYRKPEDEFPPFDLNYFVAHFRHNSTLQYHVRLPNEDLVTLGLCLPASCTTLQLGSLLERTFQERTLIVGDLYAADFKLENVRNLQNDFAWFMNGRIIAIISFLGLTLLFMILGTTYDLLVHQKYLRTKKSKRETCENNNSRPTNGVNQALENGESLVPLTLKRFGIYGKILQCFSVYTNTKFLFGTKLGSDAVPQIHGLRFLGMIWIIVIHTVFYMSNFTDNKPISWRSAEGFAIQIISNATLSVDTYFFLGGFLLSYLYFKPRMTKEDEKTSYRKKMTEFFGAISKRFLRLTPPYMMMIGIVEINLAWYNETSQFDIVEKFHDVCPKYWWRNLLYINNLFGRKEMCLSWSWYLSNDMQFFVIGTFLVILSTKYFYTSLTIILSILFGSMILTGYIAYIYSYIPTMDQQFHMLDLLYDPPWTRIGPYIIGMGTAYILLKLNNELLLRRRTIFVLWILGSSCNLLVLFGLCEKQVSPLYSAFYVGLSRTMWGVGLSWLLIACCTNNGGIVNKILTFRGWIPLSRLTYCAYLINPLIINCIYLFSESSMHIDMLLNGTLSLGIVMITYLCSYVYSLMMESPYVLMIKLFTNPQTQHR